VRARNIQTSGQAERGTVAKHNESVLWDLVMKGRKERKGKTTVQIKSVYLNPQSILITTLYSVMIWTFLKVVTEHRIRSHFS
jgi:hypothetical protein